MHKMVMQKNYVKAYKLVILLAVAAFLIVRDAPQRKKAAV